MRRRRGEMRKPMELGNEQEWHGKWRVLLGLSVVVLVVRTTYWQRKLMNVSGGKERGNSSSLSAFAKSIFENFLSQHSTSLGEVLRSRP